jgi:hypothetical protein
MSRPKRIARRAGAATLCLVLLGAVVTASGGTGVAAARKKGKFFIQRAKLAQRADGSWSGLGTLDGVSGTLTMTGAPDPSTDAVDFESTGGFRNLHWTWVAGKRRVAGCARERIIIRPHGRLLWDGGGKITKTSLQERKYLGRKVGVYGPTKTSDPSHAQISIHEFAQQEVHCR